MTSFSGKKIITGLFAVVGFVIVLLVLWSQSMPAVPHARERMQGMALPGVRD